MHCTCFTNQMKHCLNILCDKDSLSFDLLYCRYSILRMILENFKIFLYIVDIFCNMCEMCFFF